MVAVVFGKKIVDVGGIGAGGSRERERWSWVGFNNKKYIFFIYFILPPNQFICPICLGTVINDGVGSIKKDK